MWKFWVCQVLFLYGSRFGSTAVFSSGRMCNVQKSWRPEERCAAVFFGPSASDSAEDLEDYDKFMGEMTKVLHEGRREGARRFLLQVICVLN